MKTQKNNQKTGLSQVSKVVLYTGAVIFSIALISQTASAQKLWNQFSSANTYGKMASASNDPSSETEKADAVLDIINSEVSIQLNNSNKSWIYKPEMEMEPSMTIEYFFFIHAEEIEESLEYNPAKFVEAEMATEKESLMNSEVVTIIEESLEYNPEKFVEPEIAIEQESFANDNTETINEALLAESAHQIEALVKESTYNAEEFVEAEMAIEQESLTNDNTETINEAVEAESAHQIDVLMNESEYNAEKFVEAEIELEIENVMTNEEFIELAEASTANEAEQQIEKYAQKIVIAMETKPALEVENWMTDETFFNIAELSTAYEAEKEYGNMLKNK